MAILNASGCVSELTFPHWIGKATCAHALVDVIFSSGNGVSLVDDDWFRYSTMGHVFEVPVRLCPPEEVIWSKAFVTERERYDGADIMHVHDVGAIIALAFRDERLRPDDFRSEEHTSELQSPDHLVCRLLL